MSTKEEGGFFTLGVLPGRYDLPHPRIPFPVILLIRRVLFRALELLRERGFNLAAAGEDQVTAALRSVIENDLRQSGEVKGFNKKQFETVIRQGQWANFDGTRLTKTPDLFFKLRDDNSGPRRVLSEFDGLFIEAKPVDSTHAVGGRYCDDGLIRIVRGDYAWVMPQAMMLAYARGGRTITSNLIPVMSEQSRMDSLRTLQLPKASNSPNAGACLHGEAVFISQHSRDFPWPDGKGLATAVDVYHVWGNCS